MNTNDYISENPEDQVRIEKIEKFKEGIRKIFNERFLQNYISIKQDKRTPADSALTPEFIKVDALELQFAVERGPKTGFLHAHIGIFIPHYTLLKLEYEKLKGDLSKMMTEIDGLEKKMMKLLNHY